MPFDGSGYRGTPKRRGSFAAGFVLALSLAILLAPFSLVACADMVRFLRAP